MFLEEFKSEAKQLSDQPSEQAFIKYAKKVLDLYKTGKATLQQVAYTIAALQGVTKLYENPKFKTILTRAPQIEVQSDNTVDEFAQEFLEMIEQL
jgi:hypothetical protein